MGYVWNELHSSGTNNTNNNSHRGVAECMVPDERAAATQLGRIAP